MNKKQFFILSLLICPFFYQETLHAGNGRRIALVVAAAAFSTRVYLHAEHNKALSPTEKTVLAKKGYPYLDATLQTTEEVAQKLSLFFAEVSKKINKERESNYFINLLGNDTEKTKNADSQPATSEPKDIEK